MPRVTREQRASLGMAAPSQRQMPWGHLPDSLTPAVSPPPLTSILLCLHLHVFTYKAAEAQPSQQTSPSPQNRLCDLSQPGTQRRTSEHLAEQREAHASLRRTVPWARGPHCPSCQLLLLHGVCIWEKPRETRSRPWDRQQPQDVPYGGREARSDQTGRRLPTSKPLGSYERRCPTLPGVQAMGSDCTCSRGCL